jgi:hypothetical protein
MARDVYSDVAVSVAHIKSAKPSPKHGGGAVCVQWVCCGRLWCRCMSGGPKHGPYYARFWWQDGRRYKRYVRQADATEVAATCSTRREAERCQRVEAQTTRNAWREVRDLIREVEHGER